MSLLKKFASAAPVTQREVDYVTLISYSGTKPATVNGEEKDRIHAVIQLDGGEQLSLYFFKDSVYGLPNFIPRGGVPAQVTVSPYKGEDGKEYLNAISMGVGA